MAIRVSQAGISAYFKAAAPQRCVPVDDALSKMMSHDPVLVVDDDPFVLGMLSHVGRARGLEVVGVASGTEAEAVLADRRFSVVVVDLRLGKGSGLDVIRAQRQRDPAVEAIVISADRRLSSALESYAQDIFAFVPKPFDPAQLFAIVDRAIERRRGAIERQRLTWELRLLNEVATTVSASVEIDAALQTGLTRVAEAYGVRWGVLRLKPIDGGRMVVRAAFGATVEFAEAWYATRDHWPSDELLETHQPIRADDLPAELLENNSAGLPIRSSVSVPVMAGAAALGVLTLVSDQVARFTSDDERVLLAIGRQFGVAVANAQLYERVHRAKVQWERTFDAISDPIALFDHQSRTMRTNAALAQLRGWAIKDTQGRTCAEVGLCGGGCPDCLVGQAVRGGHQREQEVTTADGRIFLVTTLPVPDAAGAAVQFAKEMTEERQRARQLRTLSQEVSATNAELTSTVDRLRSTQAQLVQAEKLSAIGQLVAGVAHELNNPLTSVIGYAQLVHDEVSAKPAFAAAGQGLLEDLNRIVSESDRAARIVRNLLTFARRQSAERSRHELPELCERVIDLRAYDSRLKGIEVVTAFAPDLPPIHVDGGQIQQALLNLVLNAEQAMKESAERRLTIAAVHEPECAAVVVRISDTGHGVDPGNLARVFDPFFTTRPVGEGTGLGLSIVYGIVRDHGGYVWVDSEPGKGTTFGIRLPARCVETDGPQARAPLALVAHTDSVTRDFVSAALSGWGWDVHTAQNAREALESLREDDLQVVLTDRVVVDGDPAHWMDVWNRKAAPVPLIAFEPGGAGGDDEASRLLRDLAAQSLSTPYDLCALRQTLVAATPAVHGPRRQSELK